MKTRLFAIVAVAALALIATAIAAADSGPGMPGATPEVTHPATPKMRVRIAVTKDAKMGYNLHVVTRAFTWAPAHASSKHVAGEGHAHLYIDGTKVTRLYGEWYYMGSLAPGRHAIRVTLNGNDHADYVRDGKDVAATARVTVEAAQ
jgi:hypothetical protein